MDTSQFFTKADSDARFLAKAGKAADTDMLDGLDSTEFTRGGGRMLNTGGTITEAFDNAQTIGVIGEFGLILHCRDPAVDFIRVYDLEADDQLIVWSDAGSGTPTRDIFVSGGAEAFTIATDRVAIQAVHRLEPAVALTATVTVTDTGPECEYVVQATTNG